MKKAMPLLPLLVLAFIGLAASAIAQQTFSVQGAARVFYEPDAYDLSFAVVTDHPEIQPCKELHLATLVRVGEFLGQRKEEIFSLKQDTTNLESTEREDRVKVFRFSTAYVARIKDPKGLTAFQEGLISSGATDILGVDLFSEKLPALLDQARKQAIQDAKHKAVLAATELGWKLRGARSISFSEGEAPWRSARGAIPGLAIASRAYNYDRNNRPELTTFVTSEVTVHFAFEVVE